MTTSREGYYSRANSANGKDPLDRVKSAGSIVSSTDEVEG